MFLSQIQDKNLNKKNDIITHFFYPLLIHHFNHH